ncbi:hypothetical protein ADEAN_000082900 [Angomonas deanei]|uniref:Uncharacterized protein n=1 Tax=Angomonas deanei TaxID=59799 RepID=A0A7G2C0S6_9TRYP|nr:hypothetical protein ADEAN_000082900 [Angomonas deanei]
MKATDRSTHHVPPFIRAMAKTICDSESTLFSGPSGPTLAQLQTVSTMINNDVPLDPYQLRLLRAAYVECRHHLRSVAASLVNNDNAVAQVLAWTTRIDTVCTEAGLALNCLFPDLKEIHNYMLDIMEHVFPSVHMLHLEKLLGFLCGLLKKCFSVLHSYRLYVDGLQAEEPSKEKPRGSSVRHSLPDMLLEDEYTLEERVRPLDLDSLPLSIAEPFCVVNTDLKTHFTNIRWFVDAVSGSSVHFDASVYWSDLTMQKVWATCIGNNRAACTTEEFKKVLSSFPAWAWLPILDVVCYKDCGVITIYNVLKLLKLWGPLILLTHNMEDDVNSGVCNLRERYEEVYPLMARREGACVGDFQVTLTEKQGEVQLIVLRHRAIQPDASGEPATSSVQAQSYLMTQETGAWSIEGLTHEEFESIAEACRAFKDVLLHPKGRVYSSAAKEGTAEKTAVPTQRDDITASVAEYSTLHRTCYRNNARYVRTLLKRGAQTIVNCAVSDPSVSPDFCWTPLLCAVNNPNGDPAEIVGLLIENGADVEYSDEAECTALYYAIANNYPGAVQVLLQHCPTLRTSPTTTPLWVVLGAHLFQLHEANIRRLVDHVPTATLMSAVCPSVTDYEHASMGVAILMDMLNGIDRRPTKNDMLAVARACNAPHYAIELRNVEEEQVLDELVKRHTYFCRVKRWDVRAAAAVLCSRCYVLSWRSWLREERASPPLSGSRERDSAFQHDGGQFELGYHPTWSSDVGRPSTTELKKDSVTDGKGSGAAGGPNFGRRERKQSYQFTEGLVEYVI